jgi:predicted adenine nucleotide alpha hydrolase (AANH) superfamily ATPase
VDKSRELGLYRQPYCGCIFSEKERYLKKNFLPMKTTLRDKLTEKYS